ncbi:MAG: DUF3341 domain-containing protein [Bdellovibrionales bacterium]|nr:DUF3341 domain-containing protein [Bdellovibrionales bacterium]
MKEVSKKENSLLARLTNGLWKLKEVMGPETEPVLAGIWTEESAFLSAIKGLKQKGYKKIRAITPCPIHGLEELLEIKRSWIPWVTFVFGLLGCLFGLWFTWWTSAVDWPLIIGGKPFWSLPAFIPVIFECTILLGALSSVAALFYACGIPSVDPPVLDKDLTSHKFALYFNLKDKKSSSEELEKELLALGAEKIIHSDF